MKEDAGRLLWSTTMSRLGSTPREIKGSKKLCGSVELDEIHSDGANEMHIKLVSNSKLQYE